MGKLRPREEEVLRLAARGLDNAAIAAHLGITRGTLATHWKYIYRTLRLTGDEQRIRAIGRWLAQGHT